MEVASLTPDKKVSIDAIRVMAKFQGVDISFGPDANVASTQDSFEILGRKVVIQVAKKTGVLGASKDPVSIVVLLFPDSTQLDASSDALEILRRIFLKKQVLTFEVGTSIEISPLDKMRIALVLPLANPTGYGEYDRYMYTADYTPNISDDVKGMINVITDDVKRLQAGF